MTFLIHRNKMRDNEIEPNRASNKDLFEIWSFDGKLVYENIIQAMEDFNDKHCIAAGGYGTVYRAELPSGQVVVVKKYPPSQDAELANLVSFMSEIHALTEIRHRHIIRLLGYCSHHGCSPRVIHRDILSKNVLLNLEDVAYLSDFGTARLLNLHSSNWTSFVGTLGYAAPGTCTSHLSYQYSVVTEVNEKLDIYSFRVLTLEVVMGRHPGDLMSSLSSSSLDSSPPSSYGILLKDVLDKRLPLPRNQEEEVVVLAVKIALACLHPNPQCRPTMQQVSVALSKHKSHLQNPFLMITLGQLLDFNFQMPKQNLTGEWKTERIEPVFKRNMGVMKQGNGSLSDVPMFAFRNTILWWCLRKKGFPDQEYSGHSVFWNGAIHWLTDDDFLMRFDVDIEENFDVLKPTKVRISSKFTWNS
ncbi:MDIS1-interacting receptor like kinase 2-like [Rhododendron vialii]|uniref:MDIS1-interacting receptor like kinase 2-like n=1 Tax=Rhododendron vialii TaxID=182163 RepID=UPI00266050AF|nr:MDIS1-interacting receptor like kinase 2-like [Rhododendron vialii]